jgi:hypothetical protein
MRVSGSVAAFVLVATWATSCSRSAGSFQFGGRPLRNAAAILAAADDRFNQATVQQHAQVTALSGCWFVVSSPKTVTGLLCGPVVFINGPGSGIWLAGTLTETTPGTVVPQLGTSRQTFDQLDHLVDGLGKRPAVVAVCLGGATPPECKFRSATSPPAAAGA